MDITHPDIKFVSVAIELLKRKLMKQEVKNKKQQKILNDIKINLEEASTDLYQVQIYQSQFEREDRNANHWICTDVDGDSNNDCRDNHVE